MKVYAALYNDVSEGTVWLDSPGIEARDIVKITNTANGKSVVAEALKIDANYRRLYNNSGRFHIGEPSDSLVMSNWFRAKLGGIETQRDYPLSVRKVKFFGGPRATRLHPQVTVRVAFWLGCLGVIIALIGIVPSIVDLSRAQYEQMFVESPSEERTVLSARDVLEILAKFHSCRSLSEQELREKSSSCNIVGENGDLTYLNCEPLGQSTGWSIVAAVGQEPEGRRVRCAVGVAQVRPVAKVSSIVEHPDLFEWESGRNVGSTMGWLKIKVKGTERFFFLYPVGETLEVGVAGSCPDSILGQNSGF